MADTYKQIYPGDAVEKETLALREDAPWMRFLNINRSDFDTRSLVVQTIRDPFSAFKYNGIPIITRRKLNMLVAILQCFFMAGPALLCLFGPTIETHNCMYTEPEGTIVYLTQDKNAKIRDNPRTRLYTNLGVAVDKGHSPVAWHSLANYGPEEGAHRNRGKEICGLKQRASLAHREDLTRDYLGPFADRGVDTRKYPDCGFWSSPTLHYSGGQDYWFGIYQELKATGAHYGQIPQLAKERPKVKVNMTADEEEFMHVCIMPPIEVTAFGSSDALSYSIIFLVSTYCVVYVLGPASHSNTLFTLSYVGTVNIAGTATMMMAFLINCSVIYGIEKIVTFKYKDEIKEAASRAAEGVDASAPQKA